MLVKGLRVTAVAEDGVNEAFEKQELTFMLFVQFRPEWYADDGSDEYLSFCTMPMEAR